MVMSETTATIIKVADETWIVTALLHRENPDREDFTINEIVARAAKENMNGSLRPGVRIHATLHAVANLPPNPGRYRMLLSTGRSTRRLFRPGDPYDSARERGKIVPEPQQIPARYRDLLQWYKSEYQDRKSTNSQDSILSMRGLGRDMWVNEDPDDYVRKLRKGWDR
jgi:hypothetical protein